jgi:glutamate dehydrogenase (NAD(P)+)
MELLEVINAYENKAPEIVFEWHDSETSAKGWVVINSLKGGAAGGGTRMRDGLDKKEVISLAKTMEIKFAISGPPIGGAKSGIDFDPKDPRKGDVLKRWYHAVAPLLKTYYGTGGDLNVDELAEVIPITESYGLWHPQEGVISGHFNPREHEKIKKIGQLRAGVSKIMEDPKYLPEGGKTYKIADMITGFGVAESVRHAYTFYGENLKNKRVIVQGWGNVAAAAASYLANQGARITGIIDRVGGLIDPQGFDSQQTKELLFNRKGNELNAPNMLSFDEVNSKLWHTEADVFLPCAASRLVTREQVAAMLDHGLQMIACGANVPFADEEIFYGPICEYADTRLTLIPDFIANCGMARVFAYLMDSDAVITDEAIFADVSHTIKHALKDILENSQNRTGLTALALKKAITGTL